MEKETLGASFGLLAALVWAFAMILFKRSGEKVTPLALNHFKNTIAVALLGGTLLVMGEGISAFRAFSAADVGILVLSGFLGITVADTLFFYSLNLCGVGITALVDCLYSPFIILFSFLLLTEKLTALQYAGAALVVLAVALTSRSEPPADRTRMQLAAGILIGVLDMALMGIGIVIAKPVLARFPVMWATAMRMAAGTAVLAFLLLLTPRGRALFKVFRPAKTWRFSVPASVLGAYLSCILWIGGFKYASASVAAVLNQTSTVFALVLAALILKESFTRLKLLAVILAMAGIVLVTFGGRGGMFGF